MAIETLLDKKRRGVVTIESKTPVGVAAGILRRAGASALAVTDNGRDILGLLTGRDLVRALRSNGAGPLMSRSVAGILRRRPVTCRPDESLRRVMTRMVARKLGHILVVDDSGPRGVVSLAEILQSRLEQAERDAAALRNSITLPV